MYEVELKPCPFCGGAVKNMSVSFGVAGIITCDICKTKFVIPWNESETANDLYNAWNRRAEMEHPWPKENPHVIAHPVVHQAERFFTPEEVRAMSPEEVRQNYAAVLRSMTKWH